jgi:predicted N-formylglutamate amidohydrolase
MTDARILAALAESAADSINAESRSPLLLLCEHAGNTIPEPWDGLGLDPAYLDTHYAYDLGAGLLTRTLSDSLASASVVSRYSRIFLDYNRFREDWDYIRPDIGGIPVPGNLHMGADERKRREAVAAEPVRKAIESLIPLKRAVVAIHSFTPVMGGDHRTVDVSILWDRPSRFTSVAMEELQAAAARFGLRAADNAPYDLRQFGPRSLKTHAADHGLPYFYVEVNNGLFTSGETSGKVVAMLDETFKGVLRRATEWGAV